MATPTQTPLRTIGSTLFAIFFLGATQLSASPPDLRQVLAKLAQSDSRLASIGYRLATRNAARCDRLMPATGLVLHSLDQYGPGAREAANSVWRFPTSVSIASVVPNTPSAKAGLQGGDGILAVNLVAVSPVLDSRWATAARDSLERKIQALPIGEPIRFDVLRGREQLTVTFMTEPACRTSFEVNPDEKVIARSDGSTIQVGANLLAKIDDEQLAVVVAHELSHTILGHRQKLAKLENSPERQASRQHRRLSRQFEDEADLLSLDLLQSAGFDPWSAPRFMRTFGGSFDPIVPGGRTHRTASARAERMEKALATRKPVG